MTLVRTSLDRRNFLKSSAMAGGGLIIGFSWLAGCESAREDAAHIPDEWFDINAYLKISTSGAVTIRSPNPEFGQNVKTSMPMILAEELDIDWQSVIVEQAPFNTAMFDRQFTGGSQGIRRAWPALRMAGAAARQMLREAAAQAWQVPVAEITTQAGKLHHAASGNSAGYGVMASAAAGIAVPQEVELKQVRDFGIIGSSRRNVEGENIVTGRPLFAADFNREGMLIAMVVHAPAFGMTLKSVDDSAARQMPGIRDVFTIRTLEHDYARNGFDVDAFPDLVAVVGETTWQVMNARQALQIEWQAFADHMQTWDARGTPQQRLVPAGLENTTDHARQLRAAVAAPATERRRDGDPEAAFSRAAVVIERSYSAPFLAHNPMEPISCFAHVTADKAELAGPIQAPELIEQTLAARLRMPIENIDIRMTRMGGGFGRRAYGHYLVEAALISQRANAPVKLLYTREDDMTFGVYRPMYRASYRAALDANNNLIAFHVKAGGIPSSPLGNSANRFPAGAVENFLAEQWEIESNITTGAFRAPGSNFMASAEQSFLDEVAEAAGKDPIEFRLELLRRAKENPVGTNNDYEADRYAGVLELVREKSGWGQETADVHRGVSAYFCHNTYVAHVLDMALEDGRPSVQRVCCAIDCGIVINPDAATNMAEGAIVDGVGNALYGSMTFKDGVPERNNFNNYRMIRMREAPKAIDVHFVHNEIDPTGLGEPPFPPTFAAVANALYKATGKRYYDQPYLGDQRTT
ncbi:MAG: molybdopterin-dependent oxidoreductase [Gammaproteobacteria bacterium]|nr:molybdopterin-dependent oxidoreductase [Gammaproteobacteria bacterium]MDH5304643.1 molybdopterin-dependent oxidoreductase [Gammaproteobacteria bacterium]MDH5322500.1 molybdopterin-dependent oxidoreductase [Gammaproteobacteria bacterium]